MGSQTPRHGISLLIILDFRAFLDDEFDLLLQPSSSSSKRHKLNHPHHHLDQYQHPLSLFSAATTAVAHSLFDNSSLIDGHMSTPNKMHWMSSNRRTSIRSRPIFLV